MREGPGLGTVVLLCVLISLLVSAGVHVTLREVLPPKAAPAAPAPAAPAPVAPAGAELVDVPSIMGVDVSQARGLLDPKGLLLSLDADREDTAPAGAVITQSPLAGSRVQRGATVHATLSRGPARAAAAEPPKPDAATASTVEVPKVTGMQLGKAKDLLERAKLGLTTRGVPDEEHYPGFVLKQDPPGGAKVAPGSTVTLQISAEE